MLNNNLWIFIIISALLYLFHLLLLNKSLTYPPFIYIFYDECNEDVRGGYSSGKYAIGN